MSSLYMILFGSAESLAEELKGLADPSECKRIEEILDEELAIEEILDAHMTLQIGT